MGVTLRTIAAVLVLPGVQVCLSPMLVAQAPTQPGKAPAQQESTALSAEDKRKALEADVDRLVQLARQLRTDLEHTRQDELSLKVLRQADEIERLARSTRTRIR